MPADESAAPREIALPNPTHYYTAAWSPDSKKILYHDTNLHLWVLDVATGQAKIVGEDPWMVPTRTMNPVWSPDSKWIAYVKHLNSLFKQVVVVNVETGQAKPITDGLADATWPAWDASGKYIWFFASTDYGLRSQWPLPISIRRAYRLRKLPTPARVEKLGATWHPHCSVACWYLWRSSETVI